MNSRLVDHFRWQARACRELGSPFYGILIDALASDLERGGPARAKEEIERLIALSGSRRPFVHIGFEPYRPDPTAPLIFSAFSEDHKGLRRYGEAAPHGIPTRWY